VEPGSALAVRRAGAWFVRGGYWPTFVRALLADAAVDPLPEQIGVAEVAGVLLDHVEYHLAQRDRAVNLSSVYYGQRPSGSAGTAGRCPGSCAIMEPARMRAARGTGY
jgi:hypothetical protein